MPLLQVAFLVDSKISVPLKALMKDSLHIFFDKFHNLDLLFCVQFDVFSHLNTDDTVRRIKEILSQYSISQRLFGEAVLGLSQVSSLYTVYSVTF
jgi:hypothetical protein